MTEGRVLSFILMAESKALGTVPARAGIEQTFGELIKLYLNLVLIIIINAHIYYFNLTTQIQFYW